MDNELRDKLIALECKQARALSDLLEAVRGIPAVLQDHKLDNVARELGAKIFAVDLAKEELMDAVKVDPLRAIKVLLDGIRGSS